MSYHDRPDPYSFGDTRRLLRNQQYEREQFKRDELQRELRKEDKDYADNS